MPSVSFDSSSVGQEAVCITAATLQPKEMQMKFGRSEDVDEDVWMTGDG